MTAATLKLLALATMIIDHVGVVFFPDQVLWRIIGRFSLPLFAFAIAEGFRQTSSIPQYGLRLLLLGVVSQVPYSLLFYESVLTFAELNILFTLALGLLALMAWSLPSRPVAIGLVAGTLVAAELLRVDFGAFGILLVLSSYVFLQQSRWWGVFALVLSTFWYTLWGINSTWYWVQFFSLLAIPFCLLYRGVQGNRQLYSRYFYALYPFHLFALWLVTLLL
ncbi:MAG TPA: TraX family protein [Candidatus Paceibacterota bacterium]|nr:TraX family protein [Candidatus Paceibacterota bacterium]